MSSWVLFALLVDRAALEACNGSRRSDRRMECQVSRGPGRAETQQERQLAECTVPWSITRRWVRPPQDGAERDGAPAGSEPPGRENDVVRCTRGVKPTRAFVVQ